MSEEDQQLEEFVEIEEGTLVRDTWAVVRALGKGAYGHVYHVINVKNGVQAALKAESKSQADRVLKMEKNVLQGFKGVKGAIQLISMGTTDSFSYIVMTLCGADLTKICTTLGKITDGTLLRLAIRTLLCLKQLHEIGFVHRDVKPCNFAISAASARTIYVFDFGMTRRYAAKNEKNEWFIKRKRTRGRVDDLWSWAFMAVELRDPLPWAHLSHPETVQAVKEETPIEKLCTTGTSRVFIPIMKHFQKLGYYDRPDYQMIFNTIRTKQIMEEVKKKDVKLTDPYDWEGKTFDPSGASKVIEVCDRLGVKCYENVKTARTEDSSESSELGFLKHAFSPKPTDVPGGEKYEEKRKKSTKRENTGSKTKEHSQGKLQLLILSAAVRPRCALAAELNQRCPEGVQLYDWKYATQL
ncbi:hypothetical protein ANCCEY_00998 [Ancylostoma ceylanicum]|uniref:Protein kinase domain-containing protein n=1 Tax=Ancylostoma ceylanicum TaxID=53326 RepID=A0A0D6MD27_9BILA|nr:hypothetical protein ANCCEY_00998 [Ancylostoma ceylanicum]